MNEITRNIPQVAAMTGQNEATVRRTPRQMQILAPLVDRARERHPAVPGGAGMAMAAIRNDGRYN